MDKQKLFGSIFFIGFIIGIAYTNLFAVSYLTMTSIFNKYYLNDYQTIVIDWMEYIPRLLMIRVIPLLVMWIMTFSKLHKIIPIVLCVWMGFLWGIYMSLSTISLGIKGVVFSLVGVFPQIIFYIPAFIIVMLYCYDYPIVRWNIWKSVVVLLCVLSGILLEGQMNPFVLKWFIGIM